jgi:hypothetical protein
MTEFLLELYVAKADDGAVAAAAERMARAAAELTAEGRCVRFVRSIFVPDDETCFLLVEGASDDDVREAARRSELAFDHVAETTNKTTEVPR